MSRVSFLFLILPMSVSFDAARAEPVTVRNAEGSIHGFLSLKTLEGKVIASGDLIQTIKGTQVTSHLVYRFRDGSIDDDTAVFSQIRKFKLVTDHHVQQGPRFEHPTDVLIDAAASTVTVRYPENGAVRVETEYILLPTDLANGIILDVLKNVSPLTSETKLSYLVATPKPRLIKLIIKPAGRESFRVAGSTQKAVRFTIKLELGGILGIVAPILGKQPSDVTAWVSLGQVPAFLKSEAPLYLGSPLFRTEMAIPALNGLK